MKADNSMDSLNEAINSVRGIADYLAQFMDSEEARCFYASVESHCNHMAAEKREQMVTEKAAV